MRKIDEESTNAKSYAADLAAHGSPEALAKVIRARLDGYPETIPNEVGAWNGYQRIRDFIEDHPELFPVPRKD